MPNIPEAVPSAAAANSDRRPTRTLSGRQGRMHCQYMHKIQQANGMFQDDLRLNLHFEQGKGWKYMSLSYLWCLNSSLLIFYTLFYCPKCKAGFLIKFSFKLWAFKHMQYYLAGKDRCARHQMATVGRSFFIRQSDMCMDHRISILERNVADQVGNF